MRDDVRDYYDRELTYILGMGAQFQSKYPGVTSHLQPDRARADDPHVARLLEGFAFLTARIRAKLDDEFPELTDALLGMLHPHLARPFPSSTVVQFAPRPRAESPPGGETIPAGTPLRARHPNWRECRFRTAYPVTLWPLEVAGARLLTDRIPIADRRRGDAGLLRISLRREGSVGLADLGLNRLRFYLGGEDRVGFALHELLGSAVTRVEVRALPDRGPAPPPLILGPDAVSLVGFGADEGLVPYPSRVPRGLRFLQEYMHFPRKFLFFEVSGLGAWSPPEDVSAFELLIFLDRGPRGDLPVEPRHVLLGCTPAVNLFTAASVPIRLSGTRSEYEVVPDVPGRHRAEVYRVDRVVGKETMLDRSTEYRPFYSYRHDEPGRTPPFWYARRRPSSLKGVRGTDVDLAFVGSGFDPLAPAGGQVISVSLTCTNRDHPVGMPIDNPGGDFESEGPVACGLVRGLVAPSSPLWPPTGRGAQWRLISNLSLNYLSLAAGATDGAEEVEGEGDGQAAGSGRDALVELLTAYNASEDRAVADRIAGIVSVSGRHVLGPIPGRGAVGGVEVSVAFDESKYVGSSSFLLASVLDRFFGLYVSINAFSRLVVVDGRGGVVRRWPPRAGEKPLV